MRLQYGTTAYCPFYAMVDCGGVVLCSNLSAVFNDVMLEEKWHLAYFLGSGQTANGDRASQCEYQAEP